MEIKEKICQMYNHVSSNSFTLSQAKNFCMYYLTWKKDIYLRYRPITVTAYVTDTCNLNCNMCIHHSSIRKSDSIYYHKPSDEMSFETFKRILNILNCSISVCLAGVGEPFLNEDIFKMIKFAHHRKMFVSAITNGTIIGDKIRRIIDSPLGLLSVSLTGHDRESTFLQQNKRNDIYDETINNITNLVEERDRSHKKMNIRMSYICNKLNYKHIPKLIDTAKELNVDGIDFHNLIPSNIPGYDNEQCLYIDDYDFIDIIKSIDKNRYKFSINLPKLLQYNMNNNICEWYFKDISIDGDGNVGSCGAVITPNRNYGNIFIDSNVWNNKHFIEMRKSLKKKIGLPLCCEHCIYSSGIDLNEIK